MKCLIFSLRQQCGKSLGNIPLTVHIVDQFIPFSSEQLTARRLKAVEKLLRMLLLVIQQPGSLGLNLLPSVLNFSLNFVTPMLTQGKNLSDYCDAAYALYSLFDG